MFREAAASSWPLVVLRRPGQKRRVGATEALHFALLNARKTQGCGYGEEHDEPERIFSIWPPTHEAARGHYVVGGMQVVQQQLEPLRRVAFVLVRRRGGQPEVVIEIEVSATQPRAQRLAQRGGSRACGSNDENFHDGNDVACI